MTYNLGQTMASAGGSVGFTVSVIASIYVADPGWRPNLVELSLLVLAMSLLGVTLAVPLRKYTVKWFFPSAVACATILRAVTSTDVAQGIRARTIMTASGIASAILTFPTKVAFTKGGEAFWTKIKFGDTVALSLDPLMYGIGMVVGVRIGFSMLVGAALLNFWLIPMLVSDGQQKEIGNYIKWTAVGLMSLPALTAMLFQKWYTPPQQLPTTLANTPETSVTWTSTEKLIIVLIGTGSFVLTVVMMDRLFGLSWMLVALSVAIGAPLCLMLGKVAGTTDINPVRLLAIVLLFIFSLFGSQSPVSLLAIGIGGAALASVAVDLFYDLRTGYLIGANHKHQVAVQYFGVFVVAFAAVYFLDMLATSFGFGEGKFFPAPSAVVWSAMAVGFSKGAASLSSGVWQAFAIASVVGVVLSFLESYPKTRAFALSPFAIGIALLLSFDTALAIFVGGLIQAIFVWLGRQWDINGLAGREEQTKSDVFQAGSAIFAAAALAGIVAVVLISLGIVHVPVDH